MFVHLGQDSVVNMKDITGIFDIENTSTSKDTREFLVKMSKDNKVVYVNEDLPKSFVIAKKGDSEIIYITSISASTLKKRINIYRFSSLRKVRKRL